MTGRHGQLVRGLESTAHSQQFEGRFGRIFRALPRARFGVTDAENVANLTALGSAMSAEFDKPKDGEDDEESAIPSLYTYLGQFIDHDLTFDPVSTLQKQADPDALVDFRSPAFDLDNLYGRGPDDQPYMYDEAGNFLLGTAISGGTDAQAKDLPRSADKRGRAIIGDPRNDENSLVSQLHGLFMRFHNRMRADHPNLDFAAVQQSVRFHYQYMVLNDFLPRIVQPSVIDQLKTDGLYDPASLRFYRFRHRPFLPVEFSAAAYRLGHSMVRPGYRLNDVVGPLPIFPVPDQGQPEGLTGFRPLIPVWALDWGRFIDIDIRPSGDATKRLQLAYKLDTSLVNPLAKLPTSVALDPPPSLAQRNLLRGWRLGLPSGQSVARAMGVKPLSDEQIMIGKATGIQGDAVSLPQAKLSKVFAGNCPLWTYILAEAAQCAEDVEAPVAERKKIKTPQLGPVGGRIVAEVFLGLMYGDAFSYLRLDPHWQPTVAPQFKLKDFVRYALGG